jgi:uncharacterized GH25 family protein
LQNAHFGAFPMIPSRHGKWMLSLMRKKNLKKEKKKKTP